MKRSSVYLFILFSLFVIKIVSAETIEISTYYPAPYGVYVELRSYRMAIGETFYNPVNYEWGTDISDDADLVVEANVGIGSLEPAAALDINITAASPLIAAGEGAEAEGRSSVAIGPNSLANGNYSFAFGNNAHVNNNNSFVMGGGSAIVMSEYSYALGWDTSASGEASYAIGSQAIARGAGSFAVGTLSVADAQDAFAIGVESMVGGRFSYGLGRQVTISSDYSYALGYQAQVDGPRSYALGPLTTVSSPDSFMINTTGAATPALNQSNTVSVYTDHMGLNTVSPEAVLTIAGDVAYPYLFFAADNNRNIGYMSDFHLGRYAAGTFTETMVIDTQGDVGIGEQNPSYKLTVSAPGGNQFALFHGAVYLTITRNGASGWNYATDVSHIFSVDGVNELLVGNGRVRVYNLLQVDDEAEITNDLDVGGNITVGGELSVADRISSSRLAVSGVSSVGSLSVSSSLTAGSLSVSGAKSFVIDHPLKKGMSLVHACIEGPEAAVYYRGDAKLSGGSAVIELPDYFESLTGELGRTVLLTAKGREPYMLSYTDISNGRFTVYGSIPEGEFSWEVKAVRNDIAPLETETIKKSE